MAENKGNARLIFQFVMLLLFLVILPISSYFWMKGGTDYRVERISQLKDLGNLGSFNLMGLGSRIVTDTIAKDRMTIATFIDVNDKESIKLFERLKLLQDQLEDGLKERKDILYLIHLKLNAQTSLEDMRAAWDLRENSQFNLVTESTSVLEQVAKQNYKVDPNPNKSVFESNILTLVDLHGTVRTHYDAMNNTEMGHLVEHMAIILPKDEKKDIIFKRDREK